MPSRDWQGILAIAATGGSRPPEPRRVSRSGAGTTTMGARPPALTVKLDNANLAVRSKSAAPYPEDDRPPPLNLRPKSVAPRTPKTTWLGTGLRLSPHYNPAIRPSSGLQADRPMKARFASTNHAQLRVPPNLQPNADYRGRMSMNQQPGAAGWSLRSRRDTGSQAPARDPTRTG